MTYESPCTTEVPLFLYSAKSAEEVAVSLVLFLLLKKAMWSPASREGLPAASAVAEAYHPHVSSLCAQDVPVLPSL
jgi:hypothetical protein